MSYNKWCYLAVNKYLWIFIIIIYNLVFPSGKMTLVGLNPLTSNANKYLVISQCDFANDYISSKKQAKSCYLATWLHFFFD